MRHSSALHMLLFPPASLVHAGRNALVMKQDADSWSPDKPAAVPLAGSCPVSVLGMRQL